MSAYPKSVTAGMVKNFLAGGAAVNALAKSASAALLVVDVGVNDDFGPHPGLWNRKVARGTRNLLEGPAMTRAEAEAACRVGVEAAQFLSAQGAALLAGGEMGIGNSTTAAALTASFTGRTAREVTGRGTGVGNEGLARKRRVVEEALLKHRRAATPLDALAALDGLEIAALTGFYLGPPLPRPPSC